MFIKCIVVEIVIVIKDAKIKNDICIPPFNQYNLSTL
jgi:hypothetical protein